MGIWPWRFSKTKTKKSKTKRIFLKKIFTMPKLRKQRRKQKFQFNRNRKRIQKSQDKYRKQNIKISSDALSENWDHKQSIQTNLEKMGVAFDANKVVEQKSIKKQFVEIAKKASTETIEKNEAENTKTPRKRETSVIKRLEAEAAEANANKKQTFRFPREQVRWLSYCLDKHGDNFKAMARDPKNIWQETPKQIRQKLLKFISIPDQFNVYASERGLLE